MARLCCPAVLELIQWSSRDTVLSEVWPGAAPAAGILAQALMGLVWVDRVCGRAKAPPSSILDAIDFMATLPDSIFGFRLAGLLKLMGKTVSAWAGVRHNKVEMESRGLLPACAGLGWREAQRQQKSLRPVKDRGLGRKGRVF